MTAGTAAATDRPVDATGRLPGVLAAAAFIYVTAEIMPVGALPANAADLGVSVAVVGTLLASYALVAAVATVPLVRWTGALAAPAHAAVHAGLSDGVPGDLRAGADVRGAGAGLVLCAVTR